MHTGHCTLDSQHTSTHLLLPHRRTSRRAASRARRGATAHARFVWHMVWQSWRARRTVAHHLTAALPSKGHRVATAPPTPPAPRSAIHCAGSAGRAHVGWASTVALTAVAGRRSPLVRCRVDGRWWMALQRASVATAGTGGTPSGAPATAAGSRDGTHGHSRARGAFRRRRTPLGR